MEQNIYNAALVTHVVGITIMAGATFVDFAVFGQFRKIFPKDRVRGQMVEDMMRRLQRFMGIGMLVIILSGVTMMAYLHQVWGQQIWFRVKMGVLLLIIINGLGLRRMLGARLRKLVAADTSAIDSGDGQLRGVIGRLTVVQIVQMVFFIVIFVLSIFKFN
jgi:hypothetical protein